MITQVANLWDRKWELEQDCSDAGDLLEIAFVSDPQVENYPPTALGALLMSPDLLPFELYFFKV